MEKDTTGMDKVDSRLSYELPKVEDYGTLAQLTAGLGGAKTDVFGNQDGSDGGGYS